MKRNVFNLHKWAMTAAACIALSATAVSNAQTVEPKHQEGADAGLGPLFSFSSIFQDGTVRLQRENQEKFTLKRQGGKAYLKFDGDLETWALKISTGPANSELFKNDIDRLFLKLSDSGNLSLYSPDYHGEPIAVLDESSEIGPPVSIEGDFEKELSTYLSLRLGREMTITLADAGGDETIWLQDAARIAVKGLIKSVKDASKLERVNIVIGKGPELSVDNNVELTVYVNPAQGYYGRPSSDRVILFLKNRFNS